MSVVPEPSSRCATRADCLGHADRIHHRDEATVVTTPVVHRDSSRRNPAQPTRVLPTIREHGELLPAMLIRVAKAVIVLRRDEVRSGHIA